MDKKKVINKKPADDPPEIEEEEELEEFETVEEDEVVEFEEDHADASAAQPPAKPGAGKEAQQDSKNPLGLKVDGSRPIPVRRPPGAEGKILKSSVDDVARQEQIKKDRLESARRYESLRLYDEALKYFKLACEDSEIARIQKIMNDIYLVKAKEFESQGRFEEAANLYDILKFKDDAQSCRTKGGVAIPPLNLEDSSTVSISAFRAPNNPALMANPQKSPYIAAGQEEAAKETVPVPLKRPKETLKAFSVCPYCGEEINLPKPPKFCPYCREPFQ